MSKNVTEYLIGAAAFSIIVLIFVRLETSLFVTFMMIFALTSLVLLAFEAIRSVDEEETSDQSRAALPVGFGRALLEKMPSALILINEKGRITYANSRANQLVPRISKGNHFANLFRAPSFVESVQEVLGDGQERMVHFSLPGQDRVFEAQILQLPKGSDLGSETQVLVEIVDRTKDRRTEQMRSDFIANASHELRTPLASIMGYIETLQGHAKDDPEAQKRFLGIMANQADRMNRLVEDLMSLSRIEMNAHVVPDTSCDIHAIALDVKAALEPVARKASVSVEASLEPGQKLVQGDHDQLMQVATNLIDNAIKYGGGEVVKVFEASKNEKYPRMIGISVEDQGQGISREHLHRLTERFYRTNVAQSRNAGGTGLGLAIVKHILNRHGGELQIESQEGQGSRFTFWVPEYDKTVASPKQRAPEDGLNVANIMS